MGRDGQGFESTLGKDKKESDGSDKNARVAGHRTARKEKARVMVDHKIEGERRAST